MWELLGSNQRPSRLVSRDAFNEESHMMGYIEKYRNRFGCYPRELLADQIYCTKENRRLLKEKGIRLLTKPPGRL